MASTETLRFAIQVAGLLGIGVLIQIAGLLGIGVLIVWQSRFLAKTLERMENVQKIIVLQGRRIEETSTDTNQMLKAKA